MALSSRLTRVNHNFRHSFRANRLLVKTDNFCDRLQTVATSHQPPQYQQDTGVCRRTVVLRIMPGRDEEEQNREILATKRGPLKLESDKLESIKAEGNKTNPDASKL